MKSDAASVDLPSPSVLQQKVLEYFKSRNLNEVDMTTLLGKAANLQSRCKYKNMLRILYIL